MNRGQKMNRQEYEAWLIGAAREQHFSMVCADQVHGLCRGEVVGSWDSAAQKIVMEDCFCDCHFAKPEEPEVSEDMAQAQIPVYR